MNRSATITAGAVPPPGRTRRRLARLPVILVIVIFSIFAMLPFYMMVVMGTYRTEQLFTGAKMLPGSYLLENLKTISAYNFGAYYWNSLVVATLNTLGGIFVCALAGFAFAKYNFKGKQKLNYLVIMALAVPFQLGLVGYVIEMRMLGWGNSLLPLIFYNMANPFGVFWMTQYIASAVPTEILESGRIDGCSEYGIFFRLVAPIIKPAFITLFLLFFLWSWNNYLVPLVVVSSPKNYTIPLSISLLSTAFDVDHAARILVLTISTIPIVIMFACFSKHLIKGLVAGSVKG